jgi:hypothetical protein
LVVGAGTLEQYDPPEGVALEYDGVQYTVRAAGMMSIPGRYRTSIYGLDCSLGSDSELVDSKNQALTLTPGRHTIRLVIRAWPPRGTEGKSALVFSNPVTIEIGDAALTSATTTG